MVQPQRNTDKSALEKCEALNVSPRSSARGRSDVTKFRIKGSRKASPDEAKAFEAKTFPDKDIGKERSCSRVREESFAKKIGEGPKPGREMPA